MKCPTCGGTCGLDMDGEPIALESETIERLTAEVAALKEQLAAREATISRICDAFMIGAGVRNEETIMANLSNAIRRSNCLSAIEDTFFTELVPSDDEEEPYEECSINWGATPEEYKEQFGNALREREARLLEEMARRINDEGSRALPITFLRNEAAVRRMK